MGQQMLFSGGSGIGASCGERFLGRRVLAFSIWQARARLSCEVTAFNALDPKPLSASCVEPGTLVRKI